MSECVYKTVFVVIKSIRLIVSFQSQGFYKCARTSLLNGRNTEKFVV